MSYSNTLKFWKKSSLKDLLPPPVKAEHGEYSMILSASDKPEVITKELLSLSLKAIECASNLHLEVESRNEQAKKYANLWPGEHYRLLAGFMKALKPKVTIEVGTSTGLSSLAMKEFLPKGGKIVTFDIQEWHSYPDTLFEEKDFEEGLVQYVDDLSDPMVVKKHEELLKNAEFIFLDASHDGDLEEKMLENLSRVEFQKTPFVFLDDIRVWTMLKMWREISYPKVDLTSFGHWAGSGILHLETSISS